MQKQDRYCLSNLRSQLLDHSVYAEVASVEDLRRFMQDHVFAVWDFMSLLKRLQQDLTCTNVPWFPASNAKAARLINDIVIGEETDVDPDGSYVSHLDLYLRAMEDVGASTHQFDTFRSLARAGTSIEAAMVQTEVPPHVQAFVAHTMLLAQSGSTEEVRSEEHTSELQSPDHIVCRLLLEKKKNKNKNQSQATDKQITLTDE